DLAGLACASIPNKRPDVPLMIAGRSTRMEVLELLRRKGRCSAETIANDLGVTPNAVRQHLTNLERDGLVVSQPERSGRGRPSLLFAQVCPITPQLISRLTGAAVSQSDSIHRRDPYCSFVVQRPSNSQ